MNGQALHALDLILLLTASGLRVATALSLLPMFSGGVVPLSVRAALSMSLAVPVVVARWGAPPPVAPEAWPVLLMILREAAIGLTIGLGFGAFMAGLQTAGDIIDHQTGLTFTQNIDPTYGNSTSVTAHFLERVLFAVVLGSGFLLGLVDALYLSYQVWPVGAALPQMQQVVPLFLVAQSGRLFSLSLLLAGPVLLALFVIDAGMGMLNRAAPQLNIFNLTLSMKSLVGLAVLMLSLPALMEKSVAAMAEAARAIRALVASGG